MRIRLGISDAEIRALQKAHEEKSPKPRLRFEEWAGRELASHFSRASSQKGQWAVQATLRPVFELEIRRRLREIARGDKKDGDDQEMVDEGTEDEDTEDEESSRD